MKTRPNSVLTFALLLGLAGCVEADPFRATDASVSEDTKADVAEDGASSDITVTDSTSPGPDAAASCEPACDDSLDYCLEGACVAWPGATEAAALKDCQALQDAYQELSASGVDVGDRLQSSSDWYIDPDGADGEPPMQAHCEFDSAGGGWTRIWYQGAPNETEFKGWFGDPGKALQASHILGQDRMEVMVAYMDKAKGDAVDLESMWRLAMPPQWKLSMTDSWDGPTAQAGSWTTVVIDGATNTKQHHKILHFSHGDPGSTCGPSPASDEGSTALGYFCIEGTSAPFYTGFVSGLSDQCGSSSEALGEEQTCQTKRFALFVRRGCETSSAGGAGEDPICVDSDFDDQAPIDGDCHDDAFETYSGGKETCALHGIDERLDENCDGTIDEPDALECVAHHLDADLDGYATAPDSASQCLCEPDDQTGFRIRAVQNDKFGDCDDGDGGIHPFAEELCDDVDNDCDEVLDEGFEGEVNAPCDGADSDFCANGTWTCADDKKSVECLNETEQDLSELCGGEDENCDGVVDEEGAQGCFEYFFDGDGDTQGAKDSEPKCLCAPDEESKWTAIDALDCDDENETIFEGAGETCGDGIDGDCDGSDDNIGAAGCVDFLPDGDEDGYGDQFASPTCLCAADAESFLTAEIGGDCDDLEAAIKPGADELCDTVDNDCDGLTDAEDADLASVEDDEALCELGQGVCEGAKKPLDFCVDGQWSSQACAPDIYEANAALVGAPYEPGSEASCDQVDNDCDGAIDEDFMTEGLYSSPQHCGGCGVDCGAQEGVTEGTCVVEGGAPSCAALACETGYSLSESGTCEPWPVLLVDCNQATDVENNIFKYLESGYPADYSAIDHANTLNGAIIEVKPCLAQPYTAVGTISAPMWIRTVPGAGTAKADWYWNQPLTVASSNVTLENLELSGGNPVVHVHKAGGSVENVELRDLLIHTPFTLDDDNVATHEPRVGLKVEGASDVVMDNVTVHNVEPMPITRSWWASNMPLFIVEPEWAPMAFGIEIVSSYGVTMSNIEVTDIAVNGDAAWCANDSWAVGDPWSLDVGDDNRGWSAGVRLVESQAIELSGVSIATIMGLNGEAGLPFGSQCDTANYPELEYGSGGGSHASAFEILDSSNITVSNLSVNDIRSGDGGAPTETCGPSGPAGEVRGVWLHGSDTHSVSLSQVHISHLLGGRVASSSSEEPAGHVYGVDIGEGASATFANMMIQYVDAGEGAHDCPADAPSHGVATGIHVSSTSGIVVDAATITNVASPGISHGMSLTQAFNKTASGVSSVLTNSIIFQTGTSAVDSLFGGWLEASYSLFSQVEAFTSGASITSGPGLLLGPDPSFIDPDGGNFALQPQSPAIDAGDPTASFEHEPEPNGERVNMGYFGNTPEASVKPGATKSDPEADCSPAHIWYEAPADQSTCGCMSALPGDPQVGASCGVGACSGGLVECSEGLTTCPSAELAQAESCNDTDDDCDGNIDEGLSDLDDLCNGLDDDCDGEVDEAFQALLGATCDDGDADVCLGPESALVCATETGDPESLLVDWADGDNYQKDGGDVTAATAEPAWARGASPIVGDGILEFELHDKGVGAGLAASFTANGASTEDYRVKLEHDPVFTSVDCFVGSSKTDNGNAMPKYRIEKEGSTFRFYGLPKNTPDMWPDTWLLLREKAVPGTEAVPFYPFAELGGTNRWVRNAVLFRVLTCDDSGLDTPGVDCESL